MKNKIAIFFLNALYFGAVILITLMVTTIAITYKVDKERQQLKHSVQVSILKEKISVISLTQGLVKKINVKPGEFVKKDQILVEIDNPALRSKISALQSEPTNLSARTEANTAIATLRYFTITSNVNGVVSDVYVNEGSPVNDTSPLLDIYSNDTAKLLGMFSIDEYNLIKNYKEIIAYSSRLDQNFPIRIDSLKPEVSEITNSYTKKIGVYFLFENPDSGKNFMHNEDLTLRLNLQYKNTIKPFDYIVNFWNRILLLDENS